MNTPYLRKSVLQIFAIWIFIGIAGMFLPKSLSAQTNPPVDSKCSPTQKDSLGPFYKPGAPVRSVVDHGHKLSGTVKSARDCSPIPGAVLEFWQAGPDGKYDDAHRATLYSDEKGRYTFESNFPPRYGPRPSHIHIKVSAHGHDTFVTQYYPKQGENEGVFDLVIS